MSLNKEKEIIGKEYYDAKYFNQYPEYFEFSKSKFQQYRIKNVMALYTPAASDYVLDLGMGWGTFTFYTAQICQHVVGLDYSFTSVLLCNQRLRQHPRANVHLACADVQAVPLPGESFDVIYSADLLEHLYPNQFEGFMAESARLLKKGGKLVLWTPFDGHWAEIMKKNRWLIDSHESHVDFKSMDRLKSALINYGFSVLKAYYVESHLPLIRNVERMFLKGIPLFRRRIAVMGEKR
jgi:cyclopropane fatty-acyl-phospholipid synthase-like methyltransferase